MNQFNSFAYRASTRAKSLVLGLVRDNQGAIAILYVLTLPLFLLFAGGAVDYTRLNTIRSDMTEACDAAGLAVARLNETPEAQNMTDSERETYLTEYGTQFFKDNFQHEGSVDNLQVSFKVTEQTVEPNVSGTLNSKILKAAYRVFDLDGNPSNNKRDFSVNCDNEITLQGSGRVDLALVVDVSGSMGNYVGGDRKIDSLRDATEKLMDVLFGSDTDSDNVQIGVVPFNHLVNAGGASTWKNTWADTGAEALYHGNRFFHVDQNGTIDTDTQVNHFDLFRSMNNVSWKGCVESRPYPLDEIDVPSGSAATYSELVDYMTAPSAFSAMTLDQYQQRTLDAFTSAPVFSETSEELTSVENSYWVPMFHADEPDCSASSGGNCQTSGGFTVTLNEGTVSRTFSGDYFWFDNPVGRGYTNNNYGNRNFIDDKFYTESGYSTTQAFKKYAHIVDKSRDAIQYPTSRGTGNHGATNSELQDFQDFLDEFGASDAGADEFIVRQAYPGWYDPINNKYTGKYDQSPSVDDSGNGNRGPNYGCPTEILPSTGDRQEVKDYMETLHADGWTNSAVGTIWGERLLSPDAPFESEIADDDGQWQKAVVIMTDGENTVLGRDTHLETQLTAYGYSEEERMGVNVDSQGEMRDEIDDKFLRTCQRLKNRGYLVYTIMFDLNNSRVETLYRACASKPGEPFFYEADDGLELEEAFEDIAADLVKLHISR
ncbi:MAG: pilus assembly protein TadG-related protein [Pseudomonadota bacterium]